MRRLILIPLALAAVFAGSSLATAHDPLFAPRDYRGEDLLPALQDYLPVPYRSRYNRPRYTTGKLLHMIEPTSQEAMSWHLHVHRGTYRRHEGPVHFKFYYPKPWEVIPVGARSASTGTAAAPRQAPPMSAEPLDAPPPMPTPALPVPPLGPPGEAP